MWFLSAALKHANCFDQDFKLFLPDIHLEADNRFLSLKTRIGDGCITAFINHFRACLA